MNKSLFLGLFALLCACSSSLKVTEGTEIDSSFKVAGGAFDSGTLVIALAKAINRDGQLAICGAWTSTAADASSINFIDEVAGNIYVRYGGRAVVGSFAVFPTRGYKPSLAGERAGCVLTGQPWTAASNNLSPEIVVPPFKFKPGAGESVEFKKSTVPNLALANQ